MAQGWGSSGERLGGLGLLSLQSSSGSSGVHKPLQDGDKAGGARLLSLVPSVFDPDTFLHHHCEGEHLWDTKIVCNSSAGSEF